MSVEQAPVLRADFDQVMVPNYSPAAFIPVRGEGSRVWDQTGRELIDFVVASPSMHWVIAIRLWSRH